MTFIIVGNHRGITSPRDIAKSANQKGAKSCIAARNGRNIMSDTDSDHTDAKPQTGGAGPANTIRVSGFAACMFVLALLLFGFLSGLYIQSQFDLNRADKNIDIITSKLRDAYMEGFEYGAQPSGPNTGDRRKQRQELGGNP